MAVEVKDDHRTKSYTLKKLPEAFPIPNGDYMFAGGIIKRENAKILATRTFEAPPGTDDDGLYGIIEASGIPEVRCVFSKTDITPGSALNRIYKIEFLQFDHY